MKRVFSILFCVVLLSLTVLSAVPVNAADYGCDVDTTTVAIYLQNTDTGTVVYQQNANEKMYPASTTKIMTYIIVAENITNFDNTMINIEADAFVGLDPESSVMGLENHIGESFSVRELLYGMMVSSGNDAAWVLAEYVGESVNGFVDMMNRKAAMLGCEGTHFANPHGLFDSKNYTTAADLAKIAQYALKLPDFTEITDTVKYTCDKIDEPLKTTNYLIDKVNGGNYYYEYAKGIKTGYTDEAGKCLVSTAQKDGYNYICVALGAPYSFADDVNYAMIDTKSLYEWAFNSLSFTELHYPSDTIKVMPVEFVWGDKCLNLVADGGLKALLPKDYDKSLVTTKVDTEFDYVSAPVIKGEVFGTITVSYDGEVIGTANLVAPESIERDDSNYYIHRINGIIVNNIVKICIILVIVVSVTIIFISIRKRNQKRSQRRRYR